LLKRALCTGRVSASFHHPEQAGPQTKVEGLFVLAG
jgi:hypothetical protein